MTIPGVGDSSSMTSAAPTFRARPSSPPPARSVCDGPTVTETSDIPSLTCICVLLSAQLSQIVRIACKSYPNRSARGKRFRGCLDI